MSWPIINISDVRHVGSMEFTKKRSDSYEGSGLSVSFYPEAWRKIARISGEEFVLIKNNGKFLDITDTAIGHEDIATKWAIENKLAERCDVWVASRYDDELEDWISYESDDLTKVLHEYDLEYEGGRVTCLESGETWAIEDDKCPLFCCPKIKATEKLLVRMKQTKPCVGDYATDLCLIAYSEDVLALDGCYWSETLSIDKLSAPRAVIHSSKLNEWKISPAKDLEVRYCITRKSNLETLSREGLILPTEVQKIVEEADEETRFYSDIPSAWNDIDIWLEEELDSEEEFALLRIDKGDPTNAETAISEGNDRCLILPHNIFVVSEDVFECEKIEELMEEPRPIGSLGHTPLLKA